MNEAKDAEDVNEAGWQYMDQTLLYYEKNADAFMAGTVFADMGEARARFLKQVPEGGCLLDLGCGAGRDAKAFLGLGYRVDAADGSEELCKRASGYTGIEVKHMLFGELSAIDQYDGIWACASILHLEKKELLQVLRKIAAALKEGGVLYTSFKYGSFEGMREGRYYTDFTEKTLEELFAEASDLRITETWLTRDVRPGREEKWINILAARV